MFSRMCRFTEAKTTSGCSVKQSSFKNGTLLLSSPNKEEQGKNNNFVAYQQLRKREAVFCGCTADFWSLQNCLPRHPPRLPGVFAATESEVVAACTAYERHSKSHDGGGEVLLNVLRCQLTYQGQAETNAEAGFSKSLRPRKPEGSLGRTAQDVHLDSHTAPEL